MLRVKALVSWESLLVGIGIGDPDASRSGKWFWFWAWFEICVWVWLCCSAVDLGSRRATL